jgi:hypothetical protein
MKKEASEEVIEIQAVSEGCNKRSKVSEYGCGATIMVVCLTITGSINRRMKP